MRKSYLLEGDAKAIGLAMKEAMSQYEQAKAKLQAQFEQSVAHLTAAHQQTARSMWARFEDAMGWEVGTVNPLNFYLDWQYLDSHGHLYMTSTKETVAEKPEVESTVH